MHMSMLMTHEHIYLILVSIFPTAGTEPTFKAKAWPTHPYVSLYKFDLT